MSEYIVNVPDVETAYFIEHFGFEDVTMLGYHLTGEIVRCRDCEHATISTTGVCKYCEMWVLPDVDGYGCDSQVNLPLDFFCAYGKRKEVHDE